VTELRVFAGYTPERAEQFRQQLAEQGVIVELGEMDGGRFDYEIVSQPDGDVGLLVQQAMEAAFNEHYPGEWTFTVPIA
jgi:hypothetical protein